MKQNKSCKLITMLVAVCIVTTMLAGCMVGLVGCNPNKKVTVEDIYRSYSSPSEITSYKQEVVLPAGWSVYTNSASSGSGAENTNSDVGYIKEIDAFVITCKDSSDTNCLSIVKLGDDKVYFEGGIKGMLFPIDIGITALRYKDGLIAVKFKNGEGCIYNTQAKVMLSRSKLHSILGIDNAIKILDGSLVAVTATADVNGRSEYTSIYRPSSEGELSSRGQLVCRVQNPSESLKNVNGFDGKYVTVEGNSEGNCIYKVPQQKGQDSVVNLSPKDTEGKFVDNGKSDYYCEMTYIGGGRFFVHEDWTVKSEEEYTYFDGEKYYSVTRCIYTPDNNKKTPYTQNPDKIFLMLSNHYYDSSKSGYDVRFNLNDGFIYAPYGIFIEEKNGVKVGNYDQFILDENLNIVLSLTGNFGVSVAMQSKTEDVGVCDLLMSVTDGVFYVPNLPSRVNYFDKKGNLLGSNHEYTILSQNFANGIAVAQAKVKDGDKDSFVYGAFNQKGEIVVDFKYSSLTAFRGFYAMGVRKNEDGKNMYCLIGKDGSEISQLSDTTAPFADIAMSAANVPIFKIGCYMYCVNDPSDPSSKKKLYGIKNFNANASKNVVMNATMSGGAVLYASNTSTQDVFVFEKLTASDSLVTYVIYRLY